jgi:uncharacterized protein YndB with AHSA1/START domain
MKLMHKILIGLGVPVLAIFVFALFKPSHFRVERSRLMAASPEAVFPWFNNHRKFDEFNPWLKMDPGAKVEYAGPESGVGAVCSWDGKEVGAGTATITESQANEHVVLRMEWKRPMQGVSTVEYTFKPENGQTRVTWAMYGENGYAGKLMSLFMNCDEMCGKEFEKGLESVSKLVADGPRP